MSDFTTNLKNQVKTINPTLEFIKNPGELDTKEKISTYKKALRQLAGMLDSDYNLKQACSSLEKCSDERIIQAKELNAIQKQLLNFEDNIAKEEFDKLEKEFEDKLKNGNFKGDKEIDALAYNGEEIKEKASKLFIDAKERFKYQSEKMDLIVSEDGMSIKDDSYKNLENSDKNQHSIYLDEILEYLDKNEDISDGHLNKLKSLSNALEGKKVEQDIDKSIQSNVKEQI